MTRASRQSQKGAAAALLRPPAIRLERLAVETSATATDGGNAARHHVRRVIYRLARATTDGAPS